MNRYASALYRWAPVWGQNVMLTGFASVLARERYRGRYDEFRQMLTETQWRSRQEIQSYQDERLRSVIAHAYETVPFYRRRFDERRLKPSDIRTCADLYKVPVLTRADIRTHFDELRSRSLSPRTMRTGHTSGTTGTPLTVGYDRDTVCMTYAVFDRHYDWAGLRMGFSGDRVAVARGNVIVPLEQKDAPFWRHNWRQNQLLLSSFHLSKTNLPAYFDQLAEFRPDVIDGYPSTLYLLAKYLQNRGQVFPLKAAVTSSETLYDFQRDTIEASFGCKVFDYFALAERTVFSGECDRHHGHHIAMEYGAAEVVDGEGLPLRPGTVGQLVGTTLHNMAMPLIRYVTNDRTALRDETCPCGRGLELMDDVTTKAEDVLTLKDGRLISPSVLTHPFKPLGCIEGSQIVQTAPDAITVRIVPGEGFTQALSDHLIVDLQARLGADVRIDVQLVDALETSATGKFKWVISHVPLGI